METRGFNIRLDLSQFFDSVQKLSCIFVDLSRDSRVEHVAQRISDLFQLKSNLALLDGQYYIPAAENVNVLREIGVIKVLSAEKTNYVKNNSEINTKEGSSVNDYPLLNRVGKRKRKNIDREVVTENENKHNPLDDDPLLMSLFTEESEVSNRRNKNKAKPESVPCDEGNLCDTAEIEDIDPKKKKKRKKQKKSLVSSDEECSFNNIENKFEEQQVKNDNMPLGKYLSQSSEMNHKSHTKIKKMKNLNTYEDKIEAYADKIANAGVKYCNSSTIPEIPSENCETGQEQPETVNGYSDLPLQDISTTIKPKRKRVRTRRKRKDIIHNVPVIEPSVKANANSVFIPNSLIPRHKHIRFEVDDNCEDNANNRMNEISEEPNSSQNGVVSQENNEQSVTENHFSRQTEAAMTPENCVVTQNLGNVYDTSSQKMCRKVWAKVNSPTEEAFQKLLSLRKVSSTPVVFNRKDLSTDCGTGLVTSDSPNIVQDERSAQVKFEQSFEKVSHVNSSVQPVVGCLTEKERINVYNYPLFEGKPKKNDIIAFKVLRLSADYTPQLSDYIIAKVLNFWDDSSEIEFAVRDGHDQLEIPKGKFYVGDDDEEENEKNSDVCRRNFNELVDVRLLYP